MSMASIEHKGKHHGEHGSEGSSFRGIVFLSPRAPNARERTHAASMLMALAHSSTDGLRLRMLFSSRLTPSMNSRSFTMIVSSFSEMPLSRSRVEASWN